MFYNKETQFFVLLQILLQGQTKTVEIIGAFNHAKEGAKDI
jgi:hypothetical protein